jgi:hypothetical protein
MEDYNGSIFLFLSCIILTVFANFKLVFTWEIKGEDQIVQRENRIGFP